MKAPEWSSFLTIVDGTLNPVPLCDLDQVLLKEVMAENCGLTLEDLKKRCPEYSKITTIGESPDEWDSGILEEPKQDAEDHLSEITSTIPPVDPAVLNLRHNAFLAQLLMEEVHTELYSDSSLESRPLLSMHKGSQSENENGGEGSATAKPSPNNMPMSDHDVRELQALLLAKAEGIERHQRLDYLKKNRTHAIWSEEDDE